MFRWISVLALSALAYGSITPVRKYATTLDGRIVGGHNATIEEHPYQVSIEINGRHHCGGCLVQADVVVTAAHCTYSFHWALNNMSVRAGSTAREKDGQLSKVISIHEHPKYDHQLTDYDVCVLHLSHPMALRAGVQVISLQPVFQEIPVGTMATVTGWGTLTYQGQSPKTLQAVNVPKIADDECAEFYYDGVVTSRMHCFGFAEGEKDACQGDSGGPLVVDGLLAGIVSWGAGCARPERPGVYAKVANPEISAHIHSYMDKLR